MPSVDAIAATCSYVVSMASHPGYVTVTVMVPDSPGSSTPIDQITWPPLTTVAAGSDDTNTRPSIST